MIFSFFTVRGWRFPSFTTALNYVQFLIGENNRLDPKSTSAGRSASQKCKTNALHNFTKTN